MKTITLILTLLVLFAVTQPLIAQQTNSSKENNIELPDISEIFYENTPLAEEPAGIDIEMMIDQKLQTLLASQTNNDILQEQISNELFYVALLCGLSLTSLIFILIFFKDKEGVTARDVTNVAGLTFIIFGTIILVIIASTSEQLTAAIGVLGAIAGYLFRSAQEPSASNKGNEQPSPPPQQ